MNTVAEASLSRKVVERASTGQRTRDLMFRLALLASLSMGFVVLAALVIDVVSDGASKLSLDFLTSFPSRISPENTGVESALIGTVYLMILCALFIVPVGVATAVYLEEYANRESRLSRLIEVNIQNLAAVPSVVYGILGLAFIVRGPLGLGPVLLAGALTLGLLVLPVVIIVSREAIRAVPSSIREGSLALGATQWQTIWKHVLPGALPGVATGVILALSRAIGETAPLLVIGAATFARFNPEGITDRFTAMPLAIFEFISDADTDFRAAGAAAILVLLALLVVMNAGAIFLRNRYERKW
ncbi:MAG TPA: phosphate ABC transporter permease PstA [Thermoleophilaceae bacterium]|nr:phosphate ABC transporter permease PstA [Thermoleophilaceae bacterium]